MTPYPPLHTDDLVRLTTSMFRGMTGRVVFDPPTHGRDVSVRLTCTGVVHVVDRRTLERVDPTPISAASFRFLAARDMSEEAA